MPKHHTHTNPKSVSRSGSPLKQKTDTKTGMALVSGVPIDFCTKLAIHTTVAISINVNRPLSLLPHKEAFTSEVASSGRAAVDGQQDPWHGGAFG